MWQPGQNTQQNNVRFLPGTATYRYMYINELLGLFAITQSWCTTSLSIFCGYQQVSCNAWTTMLLFFHEVAARFSIQCQPHVQCEVHKKNCVDNLCLPHFFGSHRLLLCEACETTIACQSADGTVYTPESITCGHHSQSHTYLMYGSVIFQCKVFMLF